jgi:hypothetical protein
MSSFVVPPPKNPVSKAPVWLSSTKMAASA